jgi:hypothetical protein
MAHTLAPLAAASGTMSAKMTPFGAVRPGREVDSAGMDEDETDEDLSDFDPCKEGGGDQCERCGYVIEPWVYSRLCQGCIWDEAFVA